MIASILWDVDPVWFKVGSWEVRWYGLMWGLGFILAYEMVGRLFKKEKYPEDWVDKLFVYCIVSTVIGARLGHCLFYEWDYYSVHPAEILKIWKGGLASHGGVFAIILALVWYSKKVTKKSVWWLFDRMIPAVAVVCFCIRFGNLMNSEIYGYPTTLPWGFEFVRSREWHQLYEGLPCHPTQIYEALCYLLLFGLLLYMYWKRNAEEREGLIFGTFLIGIFLPRFCIEFIKNNQEVFEDTMLLNMGQLLSIPFILFGIYMIWRALSRPAVEAKPASPGRKTKPARK